MKNGSVREVPESLKESLAERGVETSQLVVDGQVSEYTKSLATRAEKSQVSVGDVAKRDSEILRRGSVSDSCLSSFRMLDIAAGGIISDLESSHIDECAFCQAQQSLAISENKISERLLEQLVKPKPIAEPTYPEKLIRLCGEHVVFVGEHWVRYALLFVVGLALAGFLFPGGGRDLLNAKLVEWNGSQKSIPFLIDRSQATAEADSLAKAIDQIVSNSALADMEMVAKRNLKLELEGQRKVWQALEMRTKDEVKIQNFVDSGSLKYPERKNDYLVVGAFLKWNLNNQLGANACLSYTNTELANSNGNRLEIEKLKSIFETAKNATTSEIVKEEIKQYHQNFVQIQLKKSRDLIEKVDKAINMN